MLTTPITLPTFATASLVSPLCIVASFLLVVKVFVTLYYRAFLHPYARYPGPPLARFTDLYSAYHAWYQLSHVDILRCHHKYGPIVRYGPNKLLFNDPKAFQDIYASSQNTIKARSYLSMVPIDGAWSIFTSLDKTRHRHKRRLITEALSDASIRDFEPALIKHIESMVQTLDVEQSTDGWSRAQNFSDSCLRLTLDTTADFAFGLKPNFVGNQHLDSVIRIIKVFGWRMGIYDQWPSLPKFKLEILAVCIQSLTKLGRVWLNWSSKFMSLVQENCKKIDPYGSRLSKVLTSRDPITCTSPPPQEIFAESALFMLAGSETAAVAISATLFYLLHNPSTYQQLVDEIRYTFASLDEIWNGPKLQSCSYLSACITESLRLAPPAPRAAWREAQEGGVEVNGEYIPEGCDMGTSVYAMQRNKDCFYHPNEFEPSRWQNNKYILTQMKQAISPFLIGPYSCPGRALAMLEMKLVVARLLWNYDVRLSESKDKETSSKDFRLWSHITSASKGPYIQVRKR